MIPVSASNPNHLPFSDLLEAVRPLEAARFSVWFAVVHFMALYTTAFRDLANLDFWMISIALYSFHVVAVFLWVRYSLGRRIGSSYYPDDVATRAKAAIRSSAADVRPATKSIGPRYTWRVVLAEAPSIPVLLAYLASIPVVTGAWFATFGQTLQVRDIHCLVAGIATAYPLTALARDLVMPQTLELVSGRIWVRRSGPLRRSRTLEGPFDSENVAVVRRLWFRLVVIRAPEKLRVIVANSIGSLDLLQEQLAIGPDRFVEVQARRTSPEN